MQHRIIKEISDFIFIEDKLECADVIFLPGGGHAEVPELGARVWKAGYAPIVIPSGKYSIDRGAFSGVLSMKEKYNGEYVTECDFYRDVLLKNGVPDDAIICEDRATYTKQNATRSRKLTDKLGIEVKKAIVCCKSFHARRCLMYYSYAFPDTELIIYPTDIDGITKDTWHLDERATKLVMSELRKAGGQLTDEIDEFLGHRTG
ncbi:MAG: YdcF family protein [Clostridia bacterium]|nr:YdcF family protein [Clostridia bacterium]